MCKTGGLPLTYLALHQRHHSQERSSMSVYVSRCIPHMVELNTKDKASDCNLVFEPVRQCMLTILLSSIHRFGSMKSAKASGPVKLLHDTRRLRNSRFSLDNESKSVLCPSRNMASCFIVDFVHAFIITRCCSFCGETGGPARCRCKPSSLLPTADAEANCLRAGV